MLSASDKLMTAASTGNTDLVLQLLANNSSSTLEPDEVMRNVFTMSRLRKLPAMHYRIRGDMIEMYKFVVGKNDPNCNLKLNFHSTLASAHDTRGNIYKLIPIYCKYEF